MNERARVVILLTMVAVALYLVTQAKTGMPDPDAIPLPANRDVEKPHKKKIRLPFIRRLFPEPHED